MILSLDHLVRVNFFIQNSFMSKIRPELKKYLNIFQYLYDYYQFRKENESHFSYEKWANELKVNDKSYIRLIVLGKRPLNQKMIDSFLNCLALSDDEQKYFKVLVDYTQSKTRMQKEILGQKLISLLKNELDQIEIKSHYDFLSNPLLPRLQVFLSFDDIDQSARNLAWLLNTSETEVINGLQKLLDFGLVIKNENKYVVRKKSFKVTDQFRDLGLESYYHQNLDAAKAAIQLPQDERRFRSLLLPMNNEEFNQYLNSLNEFSSQLLTKYNSDIFSGRRLYQVHFNIIPASQKAQKETDSLAESEEKTDII